MRRLLTILSAAATLAAAPASAAIVDLHFDLTATDFYSTGFLGETAPVDPVVGNFRIVFDNGAAIFNSQAGLTVTGFNLPAAAFYSYQDDTDALTIATTLFTGGYGLDSSQHNFALQVFNASTAPQAVIFQYTYAMRDVFEARTLELRPVTGGGVVPEPATWALMIGGFGLAGAALRRRAALAA